MQQVDKLTELFDKLNDLNAVFKNSQKLIPIIQSLVEFMLDTIPLLENINTSITDSTKKIPRASNQINNVTDATEMATTEILNTVDLIAVDLVLINKKVKGHIEVEVKKQEIFQKLKKYMNNEQKVLELVNKFENLNANFENLTTINEVINRINDNANNITLSLQVQDITSQQLAAVNHLIKSVQNSLSSIVKEFHNTNLEETKENEFDIPSDSAFNPDATYSKSDERQELVEELIKENKKRTSQDEIDKIFS